MFPLSRCVKYVVTIVFYMILTENVLSTLAASELTTIQLLTNDGTTNHQKKFLRSEHSVIDFQSFSNNGVRKKHAKRAIGTIIHNGPFNLNFFASTSLFPRGNNLTYASRLYFNHSSNDSPLSKLSSVYHDYKLENDSTTHNHSNHSDSSLTWNGKHTMVNGVRVNKMISRDVDKIMSRGSLTTVHYFGFAEFTTVVGETIVIFSPKLDQNIDDKFTSPKENAKTLFENAIETKIRTFISHTPGLLTRTITGHSLGMATSLSTILADTFPINSARTPKTVQDKSGTEPNDVNAAVNVSPTKSIKNINSDMEQDGGSNIFYSSTFDEISHIQQSESITIYMSPSSIGGTKTLTTILYSSSKPINVTCLYLYRFRTQKSTSQLDLAEVVSNISIFSAQTINYMHNHSSSTIFVNLIKHNEKKEQNTNLSDSDKIDTLDIISYDFKSVLEYSNTSIFFFEIGNITMLEVSTIKFKIKEVFFEPYYCSSMTSISRKNIDLWSKTQYEFVDQEYNAGNVLLNMCDFYEQANKNDRVGMVDLNCQSCTHLVKSSCKIQKNEKTQRYKISNEKGDKTTSLFVCTLKSEQISFVCYIGFNNIFSEKVIERFRRTLKDTDSFNRREKAESCPEMYREDKIMAHSFRKNNDNRSHPKKAHKNCMATYNPTVYYKIRHFISEPKTKAEQLVKTEERNPKADQDVNIFRKNPISINVRRENTIKKLLFQTSFTTITYVTTIFTGFTTSHICSRLEKITDTATEASTYEPIVANKTSLNQIYLTTFACLTTLHEKEETTRTSQDEITCSKFKSTEYMTENRSAITIEISNVVPCTSFCNKTMKQTSPSDFNSTVPNIVQPTLLLITNAYFTTSFIRDESTKTSHFETLTNVLKPSSIDVTELLHILGHVICFREKSPVDEIENIFKSIMAENCVSPNLSKRSEDINFLNDEKLNFKDCLRKQICNTDINKGTCRYISKAILSTKNDISKKKLKSILLSYSTRATHNNVKFLLKNSLEPISYQFHNFRGIIDLDLILKIWSGTYLLNSIEKDYTKSNMVKVSLFQILKALSSTIAKGAEPNYIAEKSMVLITILKSTLTLELRPLTPTKSLNDKRLPSQIWKYIVHLNMTSSFASKSMGEVNKIRPSHETSGFIDASSFHRGYSSYIGPSTGIKSQLFLSLNILRGLQKLSSADSIAENRATESLNKNKQMSFLSYPQISKGYNSELTYYKICFQQNSFQKLPSRRIHLDQYTKIETFQIFSNFPQSMNTTCEYVSLISQSHNNLTLKNGDFITMPNIAEATHPTPNLNFSKMTHTSAISYHQASNKRSKRQIGFKLRSNVKHKPITRSIVISPVTTEHVKPTLENRYRSRAFHIRTMPVSVSQSLSKSKFTLRNVTIPINNLRNSNLRRTTKALLRKIPATRMSTRFRPYETLHNSWTGKSQTHVRNTLNRRLTSMARIRTDTIESQIQPSFEGKITVTYHIPTELAIPVTNEKTVNYSQIKTTTLKKEIIGTSDYTKVSNTIVLNKKQTMIDSNDQTYITHFLLDETKTTSLILSTTTIRGRKTIFSHVLSSTVYNVKELVLMTKAPTPAVNVPLANILLSQLLLGNLGLPNQQLISFPLYEKRESPTNKPLESHTTLITELRTRTTTYVTNVTSGSSTVIPLNFRGKEILTTISSISTYLVTSTELITDTITVTSTILPMFEMQNNQQNQWKNLLLPFLQQHQVFFDTQGLNTVNEDDATILQKDLPTRFQNLQDEFSLRLKLSSVVPEESSITTLYLSGRRPGEFSTVLSTVYSALSNEKSMH